MVGDVAKALAQVFDGRFIGILVRSLLLTVGLLAALIALAIWGLGFVPEVTFTLPFTDLSVTFFDELAAGLSVGLILILSAFLMFPVAAVFVGFFLDEVADAVEARHYPHLPAARRQGWGEMIRGGLSFALVLLLANAAALVIYLLSTALAPFIFWIVNGFLLGREFMELVALRRMRPEDARSFRRRHLPSVWIMGAFLAFPLSIPILNLVAPLVGVAAFVHLYHRKAADGS